MLSDPTMASPCKDCNVLPVCMGGCPYKRLNGNDDICSSHKFILEKCLQNAIEPFKKAREAKLCEESDKNQ